MNVQIRLKKSSKEINSNNCCYCKVRRAITIMGAIEKEKKMIAHHIIYFQVIDMKILYFHVNLLTYKILL